jgi:carboxypeptidase D
MGNGWIDPENQYPAYKSYAYAAGLIKHGTDQARQVESQWELCAQKLKRDGPHVSIDECEDVLNTILRVTRDEYSPQV